jgi:hypothetical protein
MADDTDEKTDTIEVNSSQKSPEDLESESWRCLQCGAESALDLPPFNCQSCGASELEVVTGDELLVDAVELENGVTIRRREVAADAILEKHLLEHEQDDRHDQEDNGAHPGRRHHIH